MVSSLLLKVEVAYGGMSMKGNQYESSFDRSDGSCFLVVYGAGGLVMV